MDKYAPYAILVIDDEENSLSMFQMQFQKIVTVLTASSGKEALEILKNYKDKEISSVIVDQRMPEMTGLELMLQIKEEFPNIIRILFTGYSDTKVIETVVNQASIFKYIHKPYEKEEVEPIVKESIEKYIENLEKNKHLNRTMNLVQEKTCHAMENYTAWIAHHVNNSLQSIHTFVDLAANRFNKDESEINFANTTREYVTRLGNIVKNLHSIYSNSLENFVKTPISTLAKFEDPTIEEKIKEKNINITKNIKDEQLEVMANPLAIQEAIKRLITNSIEASKKGDTIELSISKMNDEEAIVVQIKDYGIGIPKEMKENLFFPFLKMGTNSENTKGLGIPYAQAIIARHGGNIMVDSQEGKGTTVTFTLPIIQE